MFLLLFYWASQHVYLITNPHYVRVERNFVIDIECLDVLFGAFDVNALTATVFVIYCIYLSFTVFASYSIIFLL